MRLSDGTVFDFYETSPSPGVRMNKDIITDDEQKEWLARSRAIATVERLYWTARDLREGRFPLDLLEDSNNTRGLVYHEFHYSGCQKEKSVLDTEYYLKQFIDSLYDDVSCPHCGDDFFSSDSADSDIVIEEIVSGDCDDSGLFFWVPVGRQERATEHLSIRCLNAVCAQRFVPFTFRSKGKDDRTALFCGSCDSVGVTESESAFERVRFFDLTEHQLAFLKANEIEAKRCADGNVFGRVVHVGCNPTANKRHTCEDFENRIKAMGLSSLRALFPHAKLVTCLFIVERRRRVWWPMRIHTRCLERIRQSE